MNAISRATLSFLCLTLAFWGAPARLQAQRAGAYVIADATTGRVLQSSQPNQKLQVGSLTKIATAMVVLDWAEASGHNLSELAVVPGSIATLQGSGNPLNLQPGDQLSLKDLLYAALLQSDNMAAETLADHVGRELGRGNPTDLFVAQMNALARRLHMDHTSFLNAHGLDGMERKLPYSTAADLGRLTRYAIMKSAFRFFVMQKDREVTIFHQGYETSHYLLHNTNELLGIDGVDGVKTGKTERAGECLIITAGQPPEARQEGAASVVTPRRLIVVMLGAEDRFNTGRQLLERGWALYDRWAQSGRPLRGGEVL